MVEVIPIAVAIVVGAGRGIASEDEPQSRA